MPPKKIIRKIRYQPKYECFKPAMIPLANLDSLKLTIDEFEAIRLVDVKKLKQTDAAMKMAVSQATLSRILSQARNKVGKAIVEGTALMLEGIPDPEGKDVQHYELVLRSFRCLEENCKHPWKQPFGEGRPLNCPKCNSNKIFREHDLST